MTVEHQLRLLGYFPHPHGAVTSTCSHTALTAQTVQPCDDVLVAKTATIQLRFHHCPVHHRAHKERSLMTSVTHRVSTYAFSSTFHTLTERSCDALYRSWVPFLNERPWDENTHFERFFLVHLKYGDSRRKTCHSPTRGLYVLWIYKYVYTSLPPRS